MHNSMSTWTLPGVVEMRKQATRFFSFGVGKEVFGESIIPDGSLHTKTDSRSRISQFPRVALISGSSEEVRSSSSLFLPQLFCIRQT